MCYVLFKQSIEGRLQPSLKGLYEVFDCVYPHPNHPLPPSISFYGLTAVVEVESPPLGLKALLLIQHLLRDSCFPPPLCFHPCLPAFVPSRFQNGTQHNSLIAYVTLLLTWNIFKPI